MTYNEFVSRPAELRIRLQHKMDDVQLKWTVCLNTVPEMSERVQSSTRNTTEACIIRYTQAKKELDDLLKEYDDAVAEVRSFFYRNLNYDDADVLDWKYCGDKSIQQIADMKEISYSGAANRIHRADVKAVRIYKMGMFEKEV